MNNRTVKLAAAASVGLVVLTGCTSITEPDAVGLYYMQGDLDGNHFDHCTQPGQTDDFIANNEIIYLPTNLRTWTINDIEGADSREGIVVSSAPQEGQPSGVQVKIWSQTKFFLNTYCDQQGGVVKDFWEKVGKRYGANTDDGWRRMLNDILVPTLQKVTKGVIRNYGADKLVGNVDNIQADAQSKIATEFATELNRLAGGDYFCGPTFKREKAECPAVEFSIIDVEYADPGIQQARNEKQKAAEEAAAKVARAKGEAEAALAEAQGKLDAANKIRELYNNPAWVKIQMAQLDLEAVKACGNNPNCKMIIGANGNLIIQQ